MRFGFLIGLASALASLSALPAPARAGTVIPIPGLFSTGMDDSGTVLDNDEAETHWYFADPSAVPAGSSTSLRTFSQTYPGTANNWSGNATYSAWIGPDNPDPMLQPVGTYYYSTSFILTADLDPSTASITAYVFGDDNITDVWLNGVDLHLQNFDVHSTQQSPFQVPWRFDIDSDFLSGVNTLDWEVPNSGGPTGLRVQMFSSVVQNTSGGDPIPEPGSIALVAVGLAATVFGYRRLSLPPRA